MQNLYLRQPAEQQQVVLQPRHGNFAAQRHVLAPGGTALARIVVQLSFLIGFRVAVSDIFDGSSWVAVARQPTSCLCC